MERQELLSLVHEYEALRRSIFPHINSDDWFDNPGIEHAKRQVALLAIIGFLHEHGVDYSVDLSTVEPGERDWQSLEDYCGVQSRVLFFIENYGWEIDSGFDLYSLQDEVFDYDGHREDSDYLDVLLDAIVEQVPGSEEFVLALIEPLAELLLVDSVPDLVVLRNQKLGHYLYFKENGGELDKTLSDIIDTYVDHIRTPLFCLGMGCDVGSIDYDSEGRFVSWHFLYECDEGEHFEVREKDYSVLFFTDCWILSLLLDLAEREIGGFSVDAEERL